MSRSEKCGICEHPDWCTIAVDETGLVLGWCCMRVPSSRTMRNGGYWHEDASHKTIVLKPALKETHTINATRMFREWMVQTKGEWIEKFAAMIGVASFSLASVGCAWAREHRAWAFPMKDGYGNTIGIRLRDKEGHKWAVRGSRAGIFMAERPIGLAAVCEGPTDTAAAISIGLNAIGRPSCLGSEQFIMDSLKRSNRALIVSDNDSPGYSGAIKLQSMLKIPSVIWCPPGKDMRQFVNSGGTLNVINDMTKNLIWRRA